MAAVFFPALSALQFAVLTQKYAPLAVAFVLVRRRLAQTALRAPHFGGFCRVSVGPNEIG